MVVKLKLPIIKISSGLMTNVPLIKKIASYKKPVFISSGMAYLDEIAYAVRLLEKNGCQNILPFHCTSEYPCKDKNVNLLAMKQMKTSLNLEIGYSDHTRDILAPTMAVSCGAIAIEKHLAISNSLAGPEKGTACIPKDFKRMVEQIRRVEMMLGNGIKAPKKTELQGRKLNRRTIFSIKAIKKNDKFDINNIGLMRGNLNKGLGLNPKMYEQLIKQRANNDIKKNHPIKLGMIKNKIK